MTFKQMLEVKFNESVNAIKKLAKYRLNHGGPNSTALANNLFYFDNNVHTHTHSLHSVLVLSDRESHIRMCAWYTKCGDKVCAARFHSVALSEIRRSI